VDKIALGHDLHRELGHLKRRRNFMMPESD
jgi:hypothetical protein